MNSTASSCPPLRSAGFTLTELLAAVTIFVIVMLGVLSLYVTYQRSWVLTNLARNTSSDASMAFERIVYGVGTNSGLRAARENSVAVSYPSGGWRIDYDDTRFLQYDPATQTIVDEKADLICSSVLNSSAAETNRGFLVSIAVAESAGGHTATNMMSSFVEFRN